MWQSSVFHMLQHLDPVILESMSVLLSFSIFEEVNAMLKASLHQDLNLGYLANEKVPCHIFELKSHAKLQQKLQKFGRASQPHSFPRLKTATVTESRPASLLDACNARTTLACQYTVSSLQQERVDLICCQELSHCG